LPFEYLDHPADIGFRTRAATLKALFADAAAALVNLVLDPARVRPETAYPIAAEGADREALLVNFLNEVLYLIDARRLALAAFHVTVFTGTRLECVALGEPRDPERHPAKLVVKAVTWHQLNVSETRDGFTADVYVDI
jgi:SHS2 domain-containing protein